MKAAHTAHEQRDREHEREVRSLEQAVRRVTALPRSASANVLLAQPTFGAAAVLRGAAQRQERLPLI